MGFGKLSVETIVQILGYLDLGEILSLRRVCRYIDRVVLGNVLFLGCVTDKVNDALLTRLLFEHVTHNASNRQGIAHIVSQLRLLQPDIQCCAEDCYRAISAALVAYKGRRWVLANLEDAMCWADEWDGVTAMVLGAWLGLLVVVRSALEKGVSASSIHPYLGSAMYAVAYMDDELLAEVLIEHGAHARDLEGAYGDALQLAAYRGSALVTRQLLVTKNTAAPSHSFGYGPYGSPLGAAAAAGHGRVVEQCLRWKGYTRHLGPSSRTPLFYASRSGRANLVRTLIEDGDRRPNLDDDFNATPLTAAVEEGHEHVVSVLLRSPKVLGDGMKRRGGKPTPLQIAASKGFKNIVKLLIARYDVDVNARYGHGNPPILAAAFNGHIDIVNLLLTKARLQHDGLLPPIVARGHVDMARQLLESQLVNPNDVDDEKYTALHHAVMLGDGQLVQLLLQHHNTNPNCQDSKGRTALFIAIEYNNSRLCEILLSDNRTSHSPRFLSGMTPLHLACKIGAADVVKYLLKRGGNLNLEDTQGFTPLHSAILRGDETVSKLLLMEDRVDAGQLSRDGRTPLYMAAQKGDLVAAHMLIEQRKIDVNCRCDKGENTPLMVAAAAGHIELILMLLCLRETKVNLKNIAGRTALYIAVTHGKPAAALVLLEHPDVDAHIVTDKGSTVMLVAALGGHADLVERLLEKGVYPGVPNFHGATPIYAAAERGHYEVVELLVGHPHVDPNQPTEYRETPLAAAARNGNEDVVRLLLEYDAFFDPARRASQRLLGCIHNPIIIQMLIEAGSRLKCTY